MDDLHLQIAAAFFPEGGQHVDKLDPTTDLYKNAKGVEMTWTGGVQFLKESFPNILVRTLAKNIWDVCHHRHVVLAMGPAVQTVSFAVMRREGIDQALIFPPHNWLTMVQEDRALQLGGIVMVGSQAVDFYNGKFKDPEEIEKTKRRARAFEAEYLRTLPGPLQAKYNSYQTQLLQEFPAFPTELAYDYRPVTPKD